MMSNLTHNFFGSMLRFLLPFLLSIFLLYCHKDNPTSLFRKNNDLSNDSDRNESGMFHWELVVIIILYQANTNHLSYSLSVQKEREAIRSIVLNRKHIKLLPKQISSQLELMKSNTFSNLRNALATAGYPLEIDDDEYTSCAIVELKSPPTPKPDLPKKNQF